MIENNSREGAYGTGEWLNMNMAAKTSRELRQTRLAWRMEMTSRSLTNTCINIFNNDNILEQESNSKSSLLTITSISRSVAFLTTEIQLLTHHERTFRFCPPPRSSGAHPGLRPGTLTHQVRKGCLMHTALSHSDVMNLFMC